MKEKGLVHLNLGSYLGSVEGNLWGNACRGGKQVGRNEIWIWIQEPRRRLVGCGETHLGLVLYEEGIKRSLLVVHKKILRFGGKKWCGALSFRGPRKLCYLQEERCDSVT